MKRIIAAFLVVSFLLPLSAAAVEETNPFETLRCGMCHKKEGSPNFPSLNEIAGVYEGKTDRLNKYFRGEAGPLLQGGSGATMNRYIRKTKALTDSERQALVDFIMRH